MKRWPLALLLILAARPALARDSLGMYGEWGAFRDAAVPRCYAIAKNDSRSDAHYTAYVDVGTWPQRGISGAVHVRLPYKINPERPVTLTIGDNHWKLAAGGADAWGTDARMDAAIIAAMRSAGSLSVNARSAQGKAFTLDWPLAGAATAMDAALLGCAGTH